MNLIIENLPIIGIQILVLIFLLVVSGFNKRKRKPDFLSIIEKEIPLNDFIGEDLEKLDSQSSHYALLAIQSGFKKAIKKYNKDLKILEGKKG